MPQRPIPSHWKERVKHHVGNGVRSDKEIFRLLEQEAEQLSGKPDPRMRELADKYPSERSISRIRKEEWPPLTAQEKAEYTMFYWPESMEREELPWEASESALELLAYLDQREVGGGERPLVRLVRWFWRVSQARPNAPVLGRVSLAMVLAINELSGKHVSVRPAEWLLAYRPWDEEALKERYEKTLLRSENRIPAFLGSFTFLPSEETTELRALMEWWFGRLLTEESAAYFWGLVPEGVDRKLLDFEEATSEEIQSGAGSPTVSPISEEEDDVSS